MLAFYHSARPRALFYAAISGGLLAFSAASLQANPPPVNTVEATISGLNVPTAITVSPDSRWVYVVNNGNNTVSVIDASSDQIVSSWDAGQQPLALLLTSNGRKLFVTDRAPTGSLGNSASVTTIDTKTASASTINTNASLPLGLAFTPDEKHVWIADTGGLIDILNVATDKLSPYPISVLAPRSIAFPSDNRAYVVTIYGWVWIYDVATRKHVGTVTVGNSPAGICVSRDRKTVYVMDQGSISAEGIFTPDVAFIDTTTKKVDFVSLPATAGVQLGGVNLAETPDGEYLYVPIEDQYGSIPGDVVMVSTKTKSVVGDPVALPVGTIPTVSIAPDGKHAYVANQTASTVTVIKITR